MVHREFTSESVTEGHPDKIADRIADSVLDECLRQDKNSRVACEVFVTKNFVLVGGEITSNAKFNLDELVRNKIKEIGYINYAGFNYKDAKILDIRNTQSPDISKGVKSGEEQGAGDQGMMFGYACNETPELMPYPIVLAHKLTERMDEARRKGILPFLLPDGKSQVTVIYKNDKPVGIKSLTIAAHHKEDVSDNDLYNGIYKEVIKKVIPSNYLKNLKKEDIIINGTGRFVIGGPHADTGLTGRKIIADAYGGYARHGGGAFSGKDPSKVDRSSAYMARYIAKHIVAAGLADECEVNFSYTIGKPHSHIFEVNTFGTGKIDDNKLKEIVKSIFDVRPGIIIKHLDLLRPIYEKTSNYGHFGRESKNDYFPWERINSNIINELKSRAKI